jgi:hypothetical protein
MAERTDAFVLSANDARQRADPAFDAVFHGSDPTGRPFQETVGSRALLYLPRHLQPPHLAVVARAAERIAETSAFLRITELLDEDRVWEIPLDDAVPYEAVMDKCEVQLFEHALYSTSGRWGLWFSNEKVVPLAGPPAFVEYVLDNFPGYKDFLYNGLPWGYTPGREQVNQFIDVARWEATLGVGMNWVSGFLEHVYGREEAQRLLREAESRPV